MSAKVQYTSKRSKQAGVSAAQKWETSGEYLEEGREIGGREILSDEFGHRDAVAFVRPDVGDC
jgi:hypothetical protein